jgi:hypothetical protein
MDDQQNAFCLVYDRWIVPNGSQFCLLSWPRQLLKETKRRIEVENRELQRTIHAIIMIPFLGSQLLSCSPEKLRQFNGK